MDLELLDLFSLGDVSVDCFNQGVEFRVWPEGAARGDVDPARGALLLTNTDALLNAAGAETGEAFHLKVNFCG